MLVKTYNQKGEEAGNMQLPKEIFEVALNSDLVYQAATIQSANRRQSLADSKGRGEVSGGGKKPYKQKGTGRARAGSTRSPIWRHGGVAFGPKSEKVFERKLNKKARRIALFMTLSAKAKNNLLFVLDDLAIAEPKTKLAAEIVSNLRNKIDSLKKGTILIALPKYDKKAVLALRNIPGVETLEAAKLNTLDLLSYKFLLMTKESVGTIKETFQAKDEKEKKESAAN